MGSRLHRGMMEMKKWIKRKKQQESGVLVVITRKMSNKCTEMKTSSHGNIILKYPAAACANQFDKRT